MKRLCDTKELLYFCSLELKASVHVEKEYKKKYSQSCL